MSKFSGKCDLYDCIEIQGGFDEFKKVYKELYVGNQKLEYETELDLAPFYGHIPIHSYVFNGEGYMKLSEDSWIDKREKEFGYHPSNDIYRNALAEEIKKLRGVDEANHPLYVYQNHLYGHYYVVSEELSYEDAHCDECGDSEYLVAEIKKYDEIAEFIKKIDDRTYDESLEDWNHDEAKDILELEKEMYELWEVINGSNR